MDFYFSKLLSSKTKIGFKNRKMASSNSGKDFYFAKIDSIVSKIADRNDRIDFDFPGLNFIKPGIECAKTKIQIIPGDEMKENL